MLHLVSRNFFSPTFNLHGVLTLKGTNGTWQYKMDWRKWWTVGGFSFRNDGDVLWLCSHADSDCERLQESSDRTLCRDSKSVLDRINQSDCLGLRLVQTEETKTTQPGQGWEGTGRSESSVITLHPLIIHRDTDSCAWHAQPTCMLKGVSACTCWHRCEHLDLHTCELWDLFTLSSPAKWHLKIPTRNWDN